MAGASWLYHIAGKWRKINSITQSTINIFRESKREEEIKKVDKQVEDRNLQKTLVLSKQEASLLSKDKQIIDDVSLHYQSYSTSKKFGDESPKPTGIKLMYMELEVIKFNIDDLILKMLKIVW